MSIRRLFFFLLVAIAFLLATRMPTTSSDLIVGRNVNMVSGTDFIGGDPYLQRQNEPSIAVSTRNPLHLLAGANDYRTVDMFIPGEELPGVHQGMAAADAWLGVFKSFDGGESWISMLLPGSLVDDSVDSLSSPLRGYQAAADPVVRAGTNGLFYYSGITFNRGQRGLGAVFVARFIDNNNKETGDPIEYLDTTIVDVGNPGHFIDKSWIAVDIPRVESPTTVLPNGQEVPCGNVYIVYTSFMGDTEEDVHGKLMFSMSIDCGATWSKPAQITDAGQPYQAATLAINPTDGRPYVAWRRFAKDKTDAIMMAWAEQKGKETVEGYWHDKLKFSKPIVVAEIAPFDQPTMDTMFRTNTYPTMTIDDNGIVYLAWAERNADNYARVVVKTFDPNTGMWYGPTQICSEDSYVWGHQFMPSLSYAAGKVTLVWYDQRYDISGVPSYYIDDTVPNQWRHTIDVRAAQSDPGPNPDFSESIQVSKYPWLLYLEDDELCAMQLKHNKPNLDLFMQGTRPFIGDYIDLCPSPPFVPNGNGGWVHNTELIDNPVFYAVWGDNRDVIESDDWINYVAPKNCTEGFEGQTGIRNQNIYTSRLSRGIIAGSPGNTKPLNIKRAFVVFIKNTTEDPKELTLTIVAPTGVTAKFQELGEEYGELDITVPPYSTTSTTVSVYQNLADEYASVTVKIWDNGNLLAQVVLNPDSTNPWIEEPDVGYEAPHVAATNETHTPHVAAYQVIEWDYESANPHVAAPHVAAPHVAAYSVNDDWVTPHVAAPHVAAPHVAAPHVAATNIINPHVAATSFPEDIPEDSSLTDVYIGVENVGNTTSSYSISTLPVDIPEGILVQLLVYRIYTTPSAVGCELVQEEHHELLSNIIPHVAAISSTSTSENLQANILNTDIPVDATAVIPPGGRVIIMYRILDPDKTDDIKVEPTSFVPQITQDAKDIIAGTEQPTPPPALIITTQYLSKGYIGLSYSQTLEAEGGYEPYTWSLVEAPGWMSIDGGTGEISGTPTPADEGIFDVIVEVEDFPPAGINPQVTPKTFSITVVYPPDLTVESLTHTPEFPTTTDDITFTAVVRNIGQGSAGPSTLELLVGGETSGDEDAQFSVPALAPGATHTVQRQETLDVAQNYMNTATADIDNDVFEDDETNNIAYDNFIVIVADTTAPTVTSSDPADDAVGIGVNADLVITFDENVVTDTGNIVIYESDDTMFETIDVTDVGKVTIVDNVVTINPVGTFEFETGYYVQIAATCFKDAAGNHYVGITDKTIWNFTTVGELVAYYPFNGNTDDASGNGNHGTTYGGATFTEDRFGNANGAINFDGIDDYVELPNENNFDLTTWTMVMILKVQDYTKTKSVISKGDNSYGNYTLDIIQQDAPSPTNIGKFGYAQAYGVGGNYSHLVTHDPVPIDQFFHIAVCFDDTSFKTFFNGQIDWSIGALPVPILNDAPVRFGLLNWGINSGHFKGQIDEIRIYNRVLSETEVNELYSTLEPSCIENAPDPWGGAHINIIPANQRWQSFLTNSSAIYKVDVDIRTLNPGYGDDTITMKILSSNDDVLTSVTQDVTDGFEGWLSFGIPAGLEVNPGETLKIQIEDTGKITFSWKYGSDSYPDGTASLSGEDFYFRINCR